MSDEKVYEQICYNKLITRRVKFVWKVGDFSKRKLVVASPEFPTAAPDCIGKWYLKLDPNIRYSSKLCVCIHLSKKKSRVRFTEAILSLINDKGAAVKQEDTLDQDSCALYVQRDFVLDAGNGVLPNDELTIVCEIEFEVPRNSFHRFDEETLQQRLADDLGVLLSSESLSDVTIAVGGAELRAHKAVLSARSPVFAAMFSNQMLEKESGVVEIADVDADVFRAMLEFMYTGKEMSQLSGAHDLLAAATKYQLEPLKLMCEEDLCQALFLDNVLENLALADLYDASRLKNQCIDFIVGHRDEILESSSWKIFKESHPSLVLDILENICLCARIPTLSTDDFI